jgi:hypothetical protein
MKQLHHSSGHVAYDLTECKLNRLTDKEGNVRFVISYPKTWDKLQRQTMPLARGGSMDVCPYSITEWEEVELDVKPYEGK